MDQIRRFCPSRGIALALNCRPLSDIRRPALGMMMLSHRHRGWRLTFVVFYIITIPSSQMDQRIPMSLRIYGGSGKRRTDCVDNSDIAEACFGERLWARTFTAWREQPRRDHPALDLSFNFSTSLRTGSLRCYVAFIACMKRPKHALCQGRKQALKQAMDMITDTTPASKIQQILRPFKGPSNKLRRGPAPPALDL